MTCNDSFIAYTLRGKTNATGAMIFLYFSNVAAKFYSSFYQIASTSASLITISIMYFL